MSEQGGVAAVGSWYEPLLSYLDVQGSIKRWAAGQAYRGASGGPRFVVDAMDAGIRGVSCVAGWVFNEGLSDAVFGPMRSALRGIDDGVCWADSKVTETVFESCPAEGVSVGRLVAAGATCLLATEISLRCARRVWREAFGEAPKRKISFDIEGGIRQEEMCYVEQNAMFSRICAVLFNGGLSAAFGGFAYLAAKGWSHKVVELGDTEDSVLSGALMAGLKLYVIARLTFMCWKRWGPNAQKINDHYGYNSNNKEDNG